MTKLLIILLFGFSTAQAKLVWSVNLIDPKKEVKRYSIIDDDKTFEISLKGSKWKCFLSKVTEGTSTVGRSIDCRYEKGPAVISSKLICHKMEFKGSQVNTFAVAEEGGTGYLMELLCTHKALPNN